MSGLAPLLRFAGEQHVLAFMLVLARIAPLFVLVDGWNLVTSSLVSSFHT